MRKRGIEGGREGKKGRNRDGIWREGKRGSRSGREGEENRESRIGVPAGVQRERAGGKRVYNRQR